MSKPSAKSTISFHNFNIMKRRNTAISREIEISLGKRCAREKQLQQHEQHMISEGSLCFLCLVALSATPWLVLSTTPCLFASKSSGRSTTDSSQNAPTRTLIARYTPRKRSVAVGSATLLSALRFLPEGLFLSREQIQWMSISPVLFGSSPSACIETKDIIQ